MKRLLAIAIAIAIAGPAFGQSGSTNQPQGTYLGKPNGGRYDPYSQNNPYGQYGSRYAPNSVNNPYGRYGSPYSNTSATNPYATQAPKVYRDNDYVGRQSANPYVDRYETKTPYDDVDSYADDDDYDSDDE